MDKKITERLVHLKGDKSDTAAARDWGIPRTTLLNLLSGDSDPKLSTLRRIAVANNTTVGWIVDGDTRESGQSVIGNGNISAGGQISGGAATTGGRISQASEQSQLEDVLNSDEAELIKGIRELGGKLLIERFKGELEKIRQFIKGE